MISDYGKRQMRLYAAMTRPHLPFTISLPDRQLQLFQPFHLRHTVPGFPAAFFILSQ